MIVDRLIDRVDGLKRGQVDGRCLTLCPIQPPDKRPNPRQIPPGNGGQLPTAVRLVGGPGVLIVRVSRQRTPSVSKIFVSFVLQVNEVLGYVIGTKGKGKCHVRFWVEVADTEFKLVATLLSTTVVTGMQLQMTPIPSSITL